MVIRLRPFSQPRRDARYRLGAGHGLAPVDIAPCDQFGLEHLSFQDDAVHHWHIDENPVTAGNAQRAQRPGKVCDFVQQFAEVPSVSGRLLMRQGLAKSFYWLSMSASIISTIRRISFCKRSTEPAASRACEIRTAESSTSSGVIVMVVFCPDWPLCSR